MTAKANEWLNRAKDDLIAAELLQTFEEYPIRVLAFHCQQAVEKSLKAFLTEKEQPFLFRHDLGYLLDLCINIDPMFDELESQIAGLTPYAVEARYPADLPLEPTKEDGQLYLQQAKNVFSFVSTKLERPAS